MKAGLVGTKLRKVTLSVLLAGSAAGWLAPPAEANRGNNPSTTTTAEPGYVPPPQYGQNPHPEVGPEEHPYDGNPLAPTVVPVDLPAVTDPGAGPQGGGDPLGPVAPVPGSDSRPKVEAPSNDGFLGGVLSRTGAETVPLARAGLAALALGVGLVVLARRRRAGVASARTARRPVAALSDFDRCD
jgi:hypothetical protein